jgi:hypothetical protein
MYFTLCMLNVDFIFDTDQSQLYSADLSCDFERCQLVSLFFVSFCANFFHKSLPISIILWKIMEMSDKKNIENAQSEILYLLYSFLHGALTSYVVKLYFVCFSVLFILNATYL